MNSTVIVPPWGSREAKLALCGEAPGKWEMLRLKPFVGPSGGRLEVWWRQVGLQRSDFYIDNVLGYMPDDINAVPRDELEAAFEALRLRLAALPNLQLIIPTGNWALYALTGKGKVSWHKKDGRVARPGIMDWRGSILSTEVIRNGSSHKVKVIPTIHPAAVLRQPHLERRCLHDWHRIAADAAFPELRLPQVHHAISPKIEDVETWVHHALKTGDPIGIDIETPKGSVTEFAVIVGEKEVRPKGQTKTGKLKAPRRVEIIEWRSGVKRTEEASVARYKSGKRKGELKSRQKRGRSYLGCIGLANSFDNTIVVPLTLKYWKSREALDRARSAVQRILTSRVDLVTQYGVTFDLPRLQHEGFTVRLEGRTIWDTCAMSHALDPRDEHSLPYMASLYTRHPFWKHEAKDPEEITKYASNNEALWTYCGIDTVSMLEIFYTLREQLRSANMLDFYHRHYTALVPVILDMTAHGIAVDDERRERELAALNDRAKLLAAEIREHAGMPLVATKGLSNDRLKFYFYGERGFETAKARASYEKLRAAYPEVETYRFIPVRKRQPGKRKSSITVDEVTIRKLLFKYPQIKDLGQRLLEFRRNRKKAEFLDGKAIDADHRLRCSYSFITEAGRFKSSGNPRGTGRNLQNIDRTMRHIFVPDKEETANG